MLGKNRLFGDILRDINAAFRNQIVIVDDILHETHTDVQRRQIYFF
jgi:hypothetical protein